MMTELWLRNSENSMLFDACDLDLELMTLVLKFTHYLDIVVSYSQTKIEVNKSSGSKIV